MQLALAREVAGPPPDLLAVYLPGLDIAQHTLLGPATAASRRRRSRRGWTRSRLLRLPRRAARRTRSRRRTDELVVVVTEPGRVTAARGLIAMLGRVAQRPTRRSTRGRSTSRRPCCTRSACRSAASSRARPLAGSVHRRASCSDIQSGTWRATAAATDRRHRERAAARSGDDRSAQKPGVCEVTGRCGSVLGEVLAPMRLCSRARRVWTDDSAAEASPISRQTPGRTAAASRS